MGDIESLVVLIADYMDYALEMAETKVLAIYLETLRDPEGFAAALQKARDRSLGREVALKTLGTTPSSRTERALLREAVLTGSLEHPNVVPVHRLGTDPNGRPQYLVDNRELVEEARRVRVRCKRQHPDLREGRQWRRG